MTQITHSVPLSKKKFKKEHLEISLSYVNNVVAYPEFYNNAVMQEKFPGLKYVNRRIMNISDIDITPDEQLLKGLPESIRKNIKVQKTTTRVQSQRANGRGEEAPEVWRSMKDDGFELKHVPISICKLPSGRNHIMDGRTRMEELYRQGFTNVIVDYYTCDNYHSFNKFGIFRNPPKEVRSPTMMKDVVHLATEEIKAGRLKKENTVIEKFIKDVTGGKFPGGKNKIMQRILSGDNSSSFTYTEQESYDWLYDHGYQNNIGNNGIFYFVVSHESVGSAVLAASRRLEELREKGHIVTKLRIVINPGYLEAADAASSWMKIADKFRDSFSENLDTIEKAYFIKPKRNDTIVLYGIIPTVKSMVQKYQLDKLVVFVNGVLENKNFGDLRFEEGLESALFT